MSNFSIGVLLDSFRCDFPSAMKKAASMGITGLQVYATGGDMAPENMTDAKIRDFLSECNDNGLTVSALCGDLGQGFSDNEKNPALIARSKLILDLAKKMGTDIVTTHIGVVPEDEHCDTYKIMQEACFELSSYADSIGSHFAVETGPEPAERLCRFLDTLSSTGVAVNLDPANLVMVTGDDPVKAVYTLKKYIVHTHAKDGKMLKRTNANEIYSGDAQSDLEAQGAAFIELPLGRGDVDYPAYLAALKSIGYNGFLTIEREVGENPDADIRLAADFLREKISEM